MQMSCDVIGHVTALDQSELAPVAPPGGETALDQSESAPHLSDNMGFHVAPPGGNKRTTNQNAPFQPIRMKQIAHNFGASELHTYYLYHMMILYYDDNMNKTNYLRI